MAIDAISNPTAASAVEQYTRQYTQPRQQPQEPSAQASQVPTQDQVQISSQAKQLAASDRSAGDDANGNATKAPEPPQDRPNSTAGKAIAAYQQFSEA